MYNIGLDVLTFGSVSDGFIPQPHLTLLADHCGEFLFLIPNLQDLLWRFSSLRFQVVFVNMLNMFVIFSVNMTAVL